MAVFIDSDFWHGKAKLPETNKELWEKKIGRNIERDEEVNEELQKQGWTIFRFSEKQIKLDVNDCVEKILKKLGR